LTSHAVPVASRRSHELPEDGAAAGGAPGNDSRPRTPRRPRPLQAQDEPGPDLVTAARGPELDPVGGRPTRGRRRAQYQRDARQHALGDPRGVLPGRGDSHPHAHHTRADACTASHDGRPSGDLHLQEPRYQVRAIYIPGKSGRRTFLDESPNLMKAGEGIIRSLPPFAYYYNTGDAELPQCAAHRRRRLSRVPLPTISHTHSNS
jgi:hypothetical protein